MANNTKRIEALEHAVNGNGSKGLKARMIQLETQYDAVKEDLAEIKDSLRWGNRFVIGQTIALAVALMLYILNNMPK